ncbi:hypothetical protein, partial [Streptomyces sp. NPDC001880]
TRPRSTRPHHVEQAGGHGPHQQLDQLAPHTVRNLTGRDEPGLGGLPSDAEMLGVRDCGILP